MIEDSAPWSLRMVGATATNHKSAMASLNRWKFEGWIVCGIAVVCFGAGSVLSARLMQLNQVRADSNRVFELLV